MCEHGVDVGCACAIKDDVFTEFYCCSSGVKSNLVLQMYKLTSMVLCVHKMVKNNNEINYIVA